MYFTQLSNMKVHEKNLLRKCNKCHFINRALGLLVDATIKTIKFSYQ